MNIIKKLAVVFLLSYSLLGAIELEKLDAQRLVIGDVGKITATVEVVGGRFDGKETRYDIFRKNSKTSIVLFRHNNEKGTILLRDKNTLYIKFRTSDRPVRINPIQRLSGDTSYGDILELDFQAYKINKTSKEEGYDILELQAKDDSATYSKMRVFITGNKLHHSELYTYSGKLLKTVYYIFNKKGIIDQYKFVVPKKKSETFVKLSGVRPMKLPNTLFLKSNLKTAYQRLTRLK